MALKNIGILGSGGWGTALALHLNGLGHRVTLWSHDSHHAEILAKQRQNLKYLPGFKIPKRISVHSDLNRAVQQNEVLILAIPTPYIRSVISKIDSDSLAKKIFINVAKGIENESLLLPVDILRQFIKKAPIAVLSGPSHAEEVAKDLPTCVVLAHPSKQISQQLQSLFLSKMFRVYTSQDLVGVQIGGAVKNVIAIAGGIVDGLRYGDNTKSALLARGTAEMVRLGAAMGAKKETFFGLAGLGDLMTTCISPHGRNRAVGEALGRGKKIKPILANMRMVAEGVKTAKSVHDLSKKYRVEMPISEQVYQVLYQNKSAKKALFDLMTRTPKAE